MHDLRVEHAEGTDDWYGYVGDDKVATFLYEWDDDGYVWLSEATVQPTWQRKGLGRQMIAEAVEYYEQVFASRASKREGYDSDTRWLTEAGAALVEACIREGIMKPEWLRNPYEPSPLE
jgi:GNAT superfamily N-acetyltransferase